MLLLIPLCLHNHAHIRLYRAADFVQRPPGKSRGHVTGSDNHVLDTLEHSTELDEVEPWDVMRRPQAGNSLDPHEARSLQGLGFSPKP